MDPKAELLIDEIATLPQGQTINFSHWRERFQAVLSEGLDDESRGMVLQSYSVFLDLFERGLVAQGRDPKPFQDVRQADWQTLCIQEALLRSDTDLFDPIELHQIVQREVAAGRMADSNFAELARAGAAVLGTDPPAPKRGFLRRLLGQ